MGEERFLCLITVFVSIYEIYILTGLSFVTDSDGFDAYSGFRGSGSEFHKKVLAFLIVAGVFGLKTLLSEGTAHVTSIQKRGVADDWVLCVINYTNIRIIGLNIVSMSQVTLYFSSLID